MIDELMMRPDRRQLNRNFNLTIEQVVIVLDRAVYEAERFKEKKNTIFKIMLSDIYIRMRSPERRIFGRLMSAAFNKSWKIC